MATIVVEARLDPNCSGVLDALAAGCAALGHDVRRWRGPISRRVPYSRRLPSCDLAILFNGAHHTYQKPLQKLRAMRAQLLFVELGWRPQVGTFQLDSQGINAAASWAREPIATSAGPELPLRTDGDLLVVLQDDDDTQIIDHSPWFAGMDDFVSHLVKYGQLPLRIRPHPRHPPCPALLARCRQARCTIDQSPSLAAALASCRAVACVNSSAAVEALSARLPVLCFGRAVYRHPGAVYCCTDDGSVTRDVTASLAAGFSELSVQAVDEVARRIVARQWTIEQIPQRLPKLITSIVANGQCCQKKSPWTWGDLWRRAG